MPIVGLSFRLLQAAGTLAKHVSLREQCRYGIKICYDI